ncbi:MAG: type II toxin-antitoxin system prevent-host-death family antitoxin [Actinomycetia bacterium]|nr:type II toxin-antitoxin system prevent-host-death family antitoxin [Actinomycetes bacterium]
MQTVGTRELKQNPAGVIARVLAGGQDVAITVYGKPTGVRLVADQPGPKRWVSGAALNAMPTVGTDDNERLKADIASAFAADDHVTDPWQGRS